jgi:predicted transcriptional regulator of viral defense system
VEERDQKLATVASSQYGVFTLPQALACGLSERTIERRTGRGVFVRLDPGLFAVGGSPSSWERDVMAAVLSVNERTAASHRTAAFLWGMTSRRPGRIEVVTTRHERALRQSFSIHESLDLEETDIVTVDSLPVTTAARTVVDLGAVAPRWMVEACLDAGLRKDLFDLGEVVAFVNRVAKRGRRGVGVIRPLLETRLEWQATTDSDLEDLFRRVVEPSGLPMPNPQFTLRDEHGRFVCRADFAYPDHLTLIELDSEKHHMDPISFQRDREKQNRATALGWGVYRFTWRQLVDAPEAVLAVLAQITAR